MLSPYQTFHCLSTICWDFFRTPIQYSKFSFLEERWVAKEFKADSKNYIKQIKRETNFLLLDSKMFVWEKNVPIAVFSLSRRPINTVCTRRLETSWADILRLPCLWLQDKHNCWLFVVREKMLTERVLGLNLKVLQHCSNENSLHNPKK